MKFFFALIIALHGLIHLMGFAKAFQYANFDALSKEISRPMGLLWLLAALFLIGATLHFLLQFEYWWLTAFVAMALSQALVLTYWNDAKFGSIINVLILLVAIAGWASWRYEERFRNEVKANLTKAISANESLTQSAIANLPEPVQRYIKHTGALNKPVIRNWRIRFRGQIRKDEKSAWMPFTTEQYNFLDPPARLFFMKARMLGFPVYGYHLFTKGKATMDIRLLSLINVQYQEGPEMDKAETVTWFNDLCLYAPGALVDKRIEWQAIDNGSSKAIFRQGPVVISAVLYFNEIGELINFTSDDRYFTTENQHLKNVRFSTPTRDYVEIGGRKLPAYGEAVWNFEKGDFCYGQFTLMDIAYNVED